MSEFTSDEMVDFVKAISQKKPTDEAKTKIPLRPPGSYGKIAHVSFPPLLGEKPRTLNELTQKEKSEQEDLKANIEVVFGKTSLTLKELAGLEQGSLLLLEDLCDDLVHIYANGVFIGRGEVVAVDGYFGVKLVSFTKSA